MHSDGIFISEHLEPDDEFESLGVFNALLDKDSNFFINVVRFRATSVPEFRDV